MSVLWAEEAKNYYIIDTAHVAEIESDKKILFKRLRRKYVVNVNVKSLVDQIERFLRQIYI
jgi:hypothetical protein